MGRVLLSVAAIAALAAGCEPVDPDVPVDGDGHAGLACVDCHAGALPEGRALALAGRAECVACHEDAGPFRVQVSETVEFGHRNHPTPWDEPLSCASCHGHSEGRAPLTVSTDGCALCHESGLRGDDPVQCVECHQSSPAVAFTSQGLEVPHGGSARLEAGCVRCHFEVEEGRPAIEGTVPCAQCHTGPPDSDLGDEDPHGEHAALACTSCHEAVVHEVLGMSSAIELQCSACHTRSHGFAAAELPSNPVCLACHTADHRAQQQLFLGLSGDGTPMASSLKFAEGLTCASCHVAHSDPETTVGDAQSCVACHVEEYSEILAWWEAGGAHRVGVVEAYLARAEGELEGDSARIGIARARARIAAVREGGVQHGVAVADALLRRALADAEEAYVLDGSTVPQPGSLGSRPRTGFCAYCHFDPGGPFELDEMPDDFHRDVLGSR